MAEHLIVGSGPLLDEQGRLREAGYALRPPFDYDHAQIKAPAWEEYPWYFINLLVEPDWIKW